MWNRFNVSYVKYPHPAYGIEPNNVGIKPLYKPLIPSWRYVILNICTKDPYLWFKIIFKALKVFKFKTDYTNSCFDVTAIRARVRSAGYVTKQAVIPAKDPASILRIGVELNS